MTERDQVTDAARLQDNFMERYGTRLRNAAIVEHGMSPGCGMLLGHAVLRRHGATLWGDGNQPARRNYCSRRIRDPYECQTQYRSKECCQDTELNQTREFSKVMGQLHHYGTWPNNQRGGITARNETGNRTSVKPNIGLSPTASPKRYIHTERTWLLYVALSDI